MRRNDARNRKPSKKNNNSIQITYVIWLSAYIGIGPVISFIIRFPMSLAVSLLVLIILNIISRQILLRQVIRSDKIPFSSGSTNITSIELTNPIRDYIMGCGQEHEKISSS